MPITLVDLLRQSVDELHGRLDDIEQRAANDGRDTLNDSEQSLWDGLVAEAKAKQAHLDMLVGRAELDAEAGQLMARLRGDGGTPDPATPVAGTEAFPYRTPGEYVLAYMRSQHGDKAEAARLTRALADVTTVGAAGLVPPQVTGDILGTWMAARPAVDAMAHPTLPPVGMEVQRPRITAHTDVQKHTEKGPVASAAFTLDLLKIPLESWAGGVDVSWELANRSAPAALDVIFQDLVRVYARNSDAGAWTTFVTDVTQSVAWDGTAGTLATALSDAAVLVAQNSSERVFPDTVWLGLTAYGLLASLVDTTGRPLFPNLGPANAYGTATVTGEISTVRGLRPVVDPNIAQNTFVLGAAEEAEFYETPDAPVQLAVQDVGVAGYNIGAIGMFGVKAVDPKAFAKITSTALPLEEEGGTAGGAGAKASK